jgi:hypothetical protein
LAVSRKVCTGKHLSDNSLIQNGLKQGDALSPQLFKFAFRISNQKCPRKPVGTGAHQLMACAGAVNLLKDANALIGASGEEGLEINVSLVRQST